MDNTVIVTTPAQLQSIITDAVNSRTVRPEDERAAATLRIAESANRK